MDFDFAAFSSALFPAFLAGWIFWYQINEKLEALEVRIEELKDLIDPHDLASKFHESNLSDFE